MNQQLDPTATREAVRGTDLRLEAFFPYRLSLLHAAISRSLAKTYSDRYDVTLHEWRTIAVLGNGPALSANQVGRQTNMDKVQVSRAVNRLLENGLINRDTDPRDRRRSSLKLSRKGEKLYREMVPIALDHESDVLAALGDEERQTFLWMMEKLLAHSIEIREKVR